MRPILRLCTGLAASVALLVALASCGGIEVVAGSISLNAGYTYCRYEVTPNRVTKKGDTVELRPVWHNKDRVGEPALQDVSMICIMVECGNNKPGKDNCRATSTKPMVVKTNFTDEKYVVVTHPCTHECTGYQGKW